MNSVLEAELVGKFMPLIKWAGMKYAMRTWNSQNFSRFYDKGIDTFCICLNKWDTIPCFKSKFKTDSGKIEFGKYFKSALFTNFLQLQMDICSKGKKYSTISFDELLESKNLSGLLSRVQHRYGIDKSKMMQSLVGDGGFHDIAYKELIKEIESALKDLDLIIFRILIEPPEELNLQILRENAKKMRYFHITGKKKKGLNSIRMTKTHILKYLNSNGKHVSYPEFNKAIKSVKCTVLAVVTGK